jgi:uncharacterized protein YjbI with pentapeptide repeats
VQWTAADVRWARLREQAGLNSGDETPKGRKKWGIMANAEHLRILKAGVEQWNQWRKNNPRIRPDLRRADLSCFDLRNANLGSADLTATNFCRANLVRARFVNANLDGASLALADLGHAKFNGANLNCVDLRAADLREAEFVYAVLHDASFLMADVQRSVFFMADLRGADFSFALGLTQSQINTASGNADTKLPDWIRMPPSWKDLPPALLLDDQPRFAA